MRLWYRVVSNVMLTIVAEVERESMGRGCVDRERQVERYDIFTTLR